MEEKEREAEDEEEDDDGEPQEKANSPSISSARRVPQKKSPQKRSPKKQPPKKPSCKEQPQAQRHPRSFRQQVSYNSNMAVGLKCFEKDLSLVARLRQHDNSS